MKDDIAEFRQFMEDLGVRVAARVQYQSTLRDVWTLLIYQRGASGRIFEVRLPYAEDDDADDIQTLAHEVYAADGLWPYPYYEVWCDALSFNPGDLSNYVRWRNRADAVESLVKFLGLENYERASDMRLA